MQSALKYLLAGLAVATILYIVPSQARASVKIAYPTNNFGLLGHWTFDGKDMLQKVADVSGQGNHGFLKGQTSTTTTSGRLGQAIYFDGVDDTVDTGDINAIDGASALTVSAWYRIEDTSNSPVIASKWNNGFGGPFLMAYSTPGPVFLCYFFTSSGLNLAYFIDVTPDRTNWHNLVCRYDGSTIRIYRDGEAFGGTGVVSHTGALISDANPVRIGSNASDSQFFKGGIDDVRIFNRALSEAEIKNLYNLRATSKQNTRALFGLWKFDEGSGTTANDSSGNSNPGTLVASPAWVAGKMNGALSFNSAGGTYVSTPKSINGNHEDLSFAAWVYPTSLPGADNVFLAGNSLNNWLTVLSNGHFLYHDIANNEHEYTGAPVPLNQWTHLAVTCKDSTGAVTMYINGSPVLVDIGGTNCYNNVSQAYNIGTGWTGYLDDVRIYQKELSASELRQLYTLANPSRMNTSQNAKVTNGLVGLWSFDGKDISVTTAYDRSGQGNDGTLTNGPIPAAGKLGQGLSFVSSNDRVQVTNFSLGPADAVAVSFWFKTNVAADNQYMVTKNFISDFMCSINSGGGTTCILGTDAGSTGNITSTSNSLTDNTWHHQVLMWSAAEGAYRTYMDGVLDKSGSRSGTTLSNGSTDMCFGDYCGGTAHFSGSLDDVRVYSRTLTPSEVLQLYKLGR
jgi:hypothetical protein